MKKGIGIGIEDFSEVIKENCYYIDKTKWIVGPLSWISLRNDVLSG